ncbi:MAG TPA: EVE domain-containing protein [Bryobacteraceae bacterium]|nr:EVE domain-containing protein [Bryobacteraceae bacterium]
MHFFLAKSEPATYSIDDLARDGSTVWDGVRNPQALQAVRSMVPGDRVFIYHSGAQPGITGLAEVTTAPRPDPKDPKSAVVELRYLLHLSPETSLHEIKSSNLFEGFSLVRQSRLSTMAVPDDFVVWMRGRYPTATI